MATHPQQLVFSSSSNPFAAAAAPLVVDPVELTGDQAVVAWAYLSKLVGEDTPVTPELLVSIAEKVSAGVLMSARQLPVGDQAVADRRRTLTAYFGLPA